MVDIVIDEEEQEEKVDEEMIDEEEYEPEVVQGKTEVVRSEFESCKRSDVCVQPGRVLITCTVTELEEIAATGAPVERHTSISERTWLQHLVDKYDDDTESMAKDHKLNVWQKTEGEIKRMIKKAGGVAKLKK